MSGPSPSSSPAPGGGFNSGQFGENFNEAMLQKAMGQKSGGTQGIGGGHAGALGQQLKQAGLGGAGAAGAGKQRGMGNLTDELIKRPVMDIFEGIKAFFDINTWLGISPPNANDPNEMARKQKMHQRYQQLTQEQQQVAQRRYQEQLQKKQAEEAEAAQRKQMEEQQKAQQIDMPSGPQKGPDAGGGSRKKRAMTKLQNDRKTLSGPSSAN